MFIMTLIMILRSVSQQDIIHGYHDPYHDPKVSQQDITFIAEFLKRFQPVESTGGSVSHLYLEKVGQY